MTNRSKIQYFEVMYESTNFGISVRKLEKMFDDEEQMYYIEIGGRKKCIDISVTKNDPKAYISSFKHHKQCALGSELASGDNGTIRMLRAAIAFVSKRFPFVEYYQFRDASHVRCQLKLHTDLWSLYLAKHRTTWYASKMNARPDRDEDERYIRDINRFLDDPGVKAAMPFRQFFDNTVKPALITDVHLSDKNIDKHEFLSNLHGRFKPIYEDTLTFRQFCLRLDTEFPRQCVMFYRWLTDLVKSVSNIPMETMDWNIHRDAVPEDINIDIVVTNASSFSKSSSNFNVMNTLNLGSRGGCACSTRRMNGK